MSCITSCQLRRKAVINLYDGTNLGFITELEFDTNSGQISSLVLSSGSGMFGFIKESRVVIPWSRIECIGEDAVLVKISSAELNTFFKNVSKSINPDRGRGNVNNV